MPIVYGNSIDLGSARTVLGKGYTYVNTEKMTQNQIAARIGAGDIVVGGVGAGGGVSMNVKSRGATRLSGQDRNATAKSILDFATNNLYTNVSRVLKGSRGSIGSNGASRVVPTSGATVPSGTITIASGATSSNIGTSNVSDIFTVPPTISLAGANFNFDKLIGIFVSVIFITSIFNLISRR